MYRVVEEIVAKQNNKTTERKGLNAPYLFTVGWWLP